MKNKIMTAIIDSRNPDRNSAISYADDAKDLTPNSPEWLEFLKSLFILTKEDSFLFKGGIRESQEGNIQKVSVTNEENKEGFIYHNLAISYNDYEYLVLNKLFYLFDFKSSDEKNLKEKLKELKIRKI